MGLRFETRLLQASAKRGTLEVRSLKVRELRAEKRGDETCLTGYAANYNTLSEDLGGWRERIVPGAFARALAEGQDIRHLQNHDPNFVLGRTASGTTVLREDAKGLAFETRLGNRSYERDLAESVARGDVDEMSFGFICRRETWVEERDADTKQKIDVRELRDVDLLDISTVTYPAYPSTSCTQQVGLDSRALFPEGAPVELRARVQRATAPNSPVERPAIIDRFFAACEARGNRRHAELRSALGNEGVLELYVYDDIGESWFSYGITAKGVKAALDGAAAPYATIRLCINSMGGDANEATAIYNLLRARAAQGKRIEARVDGGAYSAASVIAMAGDKIIMGRGAMMMVHCSSAGYWANAAQFRSIADWLDICDNAIADIYVARTGKRAAEVKAIMEAETWMGPQDCIDQGFATDLASVKAAEGPVSGTAPCACACVACVAGNCADCTDTACEDSACLDCPMQAAAEAVAQASARSAQYLDSYAHVPAVVKDAAARVSRIDAERRMRRRLRLAQSL